MTSACFSRGHTGFSRNATLVATVNPPALAGGVFNSDLVLQVLSFVAQNERENIRKRQAEGIAAAKARGVKFGRRKKDMSPEFMKIYARWKNGEMTRAEAARQCGMSASGFFYRAKTLEKRE